MNMEFQHNIIVNSVKNRKCLQNVIFFSSSEHSKQHFLQCVDVNYNNIIRLQNDNSEDAGFSWDLHVTFVLQYHLFSRV